MALGIKKNQIMLYKASDEASFELDVNECFSYLNFKKSESMTSLWVYIDDHSPNW